MVHKYTIQRYYNYELKIFQIIYNIIYHLTILRNTDILRGPGGLNQDFLEIDF